MRLRDVDGLTEDYAKQLLKELIAWLDDLGQDDAFGTEGWRHDIGWDE